MRRLVYVSTTSSVEVILLRRPSDLLRGTFVLHYNGTTASGADSIGHGGGARTPTFTNG